MGEEGRRRWGREGGKERTYNNQGETSKTVGHVCM